MKKREGFWFTVISYIIEYWLFRGYHLVKMPTKGAERKKVEKGPIPEEDRQEFGPNGYPDIKNLER